jgi:hypothetical protein
MQTTKNPLTVEEQRYLFGAQTYLGYPFYYFGSIQRMDYLPGYSDVDVDIFTNDMEDTLRKLRQYSNQPNKKIKKIIWKLQSGRIVYGYKYHFRNHNPPYINIEFSIYPFKYKSDVLHDHLTKMNLPWYCIILLLIWKTLFYQFPLLSLDTYRWLKKKTMTFCIGLPDETFITIT